MSDKKHNLFDEFAPVSAEEWKAKIAADLKGKPYDSLLWETAEGITVKPDYSSADIEGPTITTQSINGWHLRQDVDIQDISESNKTVLEALNAGVNSLGLLQKNKLSTADIAQLMEGVEPTYIRTEVVCKGEWIPAWLAYFTQKNNAAEGSFDFDPLAQKGKLAEEDITLIKKTLADLNNFKAITVQAPERGSAVEELTHILAKGHQYLFELTEKGLSAKQVLDSIQFSIPISADYFMQIAKLRVLQQLWSVVAAQYGVEAARPFIQSYNAPAQQIGSEPYTNMLRHTTQAMSAAIGGSRVINVWDSSQTDDRSNAFFQRIARNVQHILQYESHLDKVADPGAGSYYIESLTHELATQTWETFKTLEQAGGYPKMMTSHAS